MAREFKRRNLPVSVLVIDFLHWEQTGDWKLDPKYWPDPLAMVKEMNDLGIRIMISPWIFVVPESENFAYMRDHDLFIHYKNTPISGSRDNIPGARF